MEDVVVAVWAALLRTFQWTGGHADFAGALRDPDLLRTMGQRWPIPSGAKPSTPSWESKPAASLSARW